LVVDGDLDLAAAPAEAEADAFPVVGHPRIEGNPAPGDAQPTEPVAEDLPSPARGGDMHALVGVALVVAEVHIGRALEILDRPSSVADLDTHDRVDRGAQRRL